MSLCHDKSAEWSRDKSSGTERTGNLTEVLALENYRRRTGDGKESWILTFRRLKPVLLLPRTCFGDTAPPLARGLEGRPIAAFRGGAGALSSSGVGGNWFIAGALRCCCTAGALTSSSWLFTGASASTFFFLGADVGGRGPPFPPRGPAPSCASPTNFFAVGSGSAFLFTDDTASTVAGRSIEDLFSPGDNSESLLARSDWDLDC